MVLNYQKHGRLVLDLIMILKLKDIIPGLLESASAKYFSAINKLSVPVRRGRQTGFKNALHASPGASFSS